MYDMKNEMKSFVPATRIKEIIEKYEPDATFEN